MEERKPKPVLKNGCKQKQISKYLTFIGVRGLLVFPGKNQVRQFFQFSPAVVSGSKKNT